MRNPTWQRDELILALDLYFKLEHSQIHARNPDIITLSELLNRLPIHEVRPDAAKFRNPNGVGLKLSNFKAIDPNYSGKGMAAGGKLDKVVFEEYNANRGLLSTHAVRIKEAVADTELLDQLSYVDGAEKESAKEGAVIFKLHRVRERNPRLIRKKKAYVLKAAGRLACEVCKFDFQATYGVLGHGFIECHHKTPLSELTVETATTVDDLALVCANCHRMLHRSGNISIADLRSFMGS